MPRLLGKATDGHLEGFQLKKADILLEHSRHSFWGRLIRTGTGSYWNHALMVFDVEDTSQGYQNVSLIDPRMNEINIRSVADYFKGLDGYDAGVRRLEKEWFQRDGETSAMRYRSAVASYAEKETRNKRDSTSVLKSVRKLVREFIIAYRFLLQKVTLSKPGRKGSCPARKLFGSAAYSCSGFVQWSYYRAMAQMVAEGNLDASRLQEVIFDPCLGLEAADHDLLAISPAALARSDKLSWKYIIKDGVVWEVSSEEDVNSILNPGKNRN